jgi:hypothetical protein
MSLKLTTLLKCWYKEKGETNIFQAQLRMFFIFLYLYVFFYIDINFIIL